MSQEILDQREVVHIDIAYDEFSSGEYREDLVSSLYIHFVALYKPESLCNITY